MPGFSDGSRAPQSDFGSIKTSFSILFSSLITRHENEEICKGKMFLVKEFQVSFMLIQIYTKKVGDLAVLLAYVKVGDKTVEKTFLTAKAFTDWLMDKNQLE